MYWLFIEKLAVINRSDTWQTRKITGFISEHNVIQSSYIALTHCKDVFLKQYKTMEKSPSVLEAEDAGSVQLLTRLHQFVKVWEQTTVNWQEK